MLLVTQAVFDELVHLVDPGVEPYKPKKGQPNVIMAVGLQVSTSPSLRPFFRPFTVISREMGRPPHAQNWLFTIRNVVSSHVSSVRTLSARVLLTRPDSPQPRLK
jgi:hypothetical protein